MNTTIANTDRRAFLKTLAVGTGGCAVGAFLIQPRIAMGQSQQGASPGIPMEVRWAAAARIATRFQVNWHKTLLDKEGPERFREIMKQGSRSMGAESKAIADKLGLTVTDARSLAATMQTLGNMYYGPSMKYEIEEASAEKARVNCVECTFWNTVQAAKINDDICSVFSQYFWEGFAKSGSPNLTVNLVKARPLGDSFCEFAIEHKETLT